MRPVRLAVLPLAVGVGLLGAALGGSLPAHAGLARAAADTEATAILTCPGASDGQADGGPAGASGSCGKPVTGTDGQGQVRLGGSITYSACGNALQRDCASVSFAVVSPTGATVLPFSVAETRTASFAQSGSASSPTQILAANQPNGVWTVRFGGDAAGSATFTLAVPPSAPTRLAADTSTAGQATVTWAQSTPTAASSYALQVDGQPTSLTPACDDGGCTGTVTGLGAGDHTFTVVASRPDGAGGSLTASASVDGTVAAVPPATSPGASPSTGSGGAGSGTGSGTGTGSGGTGSGGKGSGGTTSGGSTGTVTAGGSTAGTGTKAGTASSASAAQTAALAAAVAAQQRAANFQSFTPAAGIAQLPPLPKFPAATSAGNGEPESPGTYVPTLPYDGHQTVTERITKPTLLGHVSDAVSDRTLLESIAAAGLVLLLAAHVRLYARRDPAADL